MAECGGLPEPGGDQGDHLGDWGTPRSVEDKLLLAELMDSWKVTKPDLFGSRGEGTSLGGYPAVELPDRGDQVSSEQGGLGVQGLELVIGQGSVARRFRRRLLHKL